MPEIPPIGAELAGFRLESLVSHGGMAVVYRAQELRLGRQVALKVLATDLAEDDTFRQRFLRESRMAAAMNHPNIVPIYDAGEAEGHLYIAMRHVEGTDLRALLRREAPLEIDRTVSIVTQIASALEAAHERGLIHRDVKPANALVVPRESSHSLDYIYLTDFGLAKHVESISGLTQTGQFVGTVNYVAPEQIEGRSVDARTDIYALGCVLFECLTGVPPFRHEDQMTVIMAHLREQPPRVTDMRPEAPPALADVVARTMAKSPDDRFSSCDELILAVRAAEPGAGVVAPAAAERAAPSADAAAASAPRSVASVPGPSAPGGPGAAGSTVARVPRRRMAALAAAVLVIGAAAGATGTVLLRDRGHEDGRTSAASAERPSPGPSGRVYDTIVLPHVPEAIRPTCRETGQPPDLIRGYGLGTAACTAQDGQVRVSYTKVHSAERAYQLLFAVALRELGVNIAGGSARSGSCSTEAETWNYWHRPPSGGDAAHAEGRFRGTGRNPVSGLVVCFRRGSRAVIQWVDSSTGLYGIAEAATAFPDLASWWRTGAGPLLDPVPPGANT